MEVQRQLEPGELLARGGAQRGDLRREGHAGGVAQRHPVYAQVREALHPAEHLFQRHVALHRAAHRRRQRDIDGGRRFPHHADHVRQLRQRLLARHAQVGAVVAFAHRHDQVDLVDLARQRAFGAAHIGHQHRVDHAFSSRDAMHDGFGVAQRRDRFGRGEGRHLDLGVAACAQVVDQGDLVVGVDKLRLVLEAVPGGDFLDIHSLGIHAGLLLK
ncbi:hypothetical protein D3C72_1439080 [compost metagenome]